MDTHYPPHPNTSRVPHTTTDQPPQLHSSQLALCHDVTLDIMTHRWVLLNTHSTTVPERRGCGYPKHKHEPTGTHRSACAAHFSRGSGAVFRTTSTNTTLSSSLSGDRACARLTTSGGCDRQQDSSGPSSHEKPATRGNSRAPPQRA